MVWFEILPSLVITAAPLLLVAAPVLYVGNWYFLNGKVRFVKDNSCVDELLICLSRNTDREI